MRICCGNSGKEPSAGTSRVIIGIRPMSPPPPRTQKGNPDSIAFSFLFYVDSHPTFQNTPLKLFADSAPGCPFFWFLGCLSPHLPSVKAPPPFVFHFPSSACSLRMPRGLCGAGATASGDSWGTLGPQGPPGKDDKGWKCWVTVRSLNI